MAIAKAESLNPASQISSKDMLAQYQAFLQFQRMNQIQQQQQQPIARRDDSSSSSGATADGGDAKRRKTGPNPSEYAATPGAGAAGPLVPQSGDLFKNEPAAAANVGGAAPASGSGVGPPSQADVVPGKPVARSR
jgi:hypothetical protein